MAALFKPVRIVFFALVSLVGSGAFGGTVSERHNTLAREVVQLVLKHGAFETMMEEAADTAMDVMRVGFQAELGRELTYSENAKIRTAFRRAMSTVYPQKVWEDAVVPLYMKYFDAAEMEQVLEFYKTPLGLKMLVLTPRLQQEGAQAGRDLVRTRETEFLRRFEYEIRKELSQ